MSRINTVLTLTGPQDSPEPAVADEAPARKPSKSDAAKADVADPIEETP